MMNAQLERVFYFALCTLLAVSCLQLLATTEAKPLPADHNETSLENQTRPEVTCQCNRTNLTMMVDGHFLYKWRAFDTHHSIRHLSESAAKLVDSTNNLQVCC